MLVYTPRLSKKNSETVRRISWGFKIPMTKVLANLIELGATFIDKRNICKECKDKNFCEDCIFKSKPRTKLPVKKLILKKTGYRFKSKNK